MRAVVVAVAVAVAVVGASVVVRVVRRRVGLGMEVGSLDAVVAVAVVESPVRTNPVSRRLC